MAAAAASSVREASHDSAITDDAVAAPTAARAQQRGYLRMAMHVGSNAAMREWPKRRLGAKWNVRRGLGCGIMVDWVCAVDIPTVFTFNIRYMRKLSMRYN